MFFPVGLWNVIKVQNLVLVIAFATIFPHIHSQIQRPSAPAWCLTSAPKETSALTASKWRRQGGGGQSVTACWQPWSVLASNCRCWSRGAAYNNPLALCAHHDHCIKCKLSHPRKSFVGYGRISASKQKDEKKKYSSFNSFLGEGWQ